MCKQQSLTQSQYGMLKVKSIHDKLHFDDILLLEVVLTNTSQKIY